MAASSLSYLGPFTGLFRENFIDNWLTKCRESNINLPVASDYSLRHVLGNELTIKEWNSMTLPSDSISIDNAILVTNSVSYPLMIDP